METIDKEFVNAVVDRDAREMDLLAKVEEHLGSIRSMLKFFVVLTVLYIVFSVWNFMMMVFG